MAPVTTHEFVVNIGGVDKTALVLVSSLFVRNNIQNERSTAEFVVADLADNYTPGDWDEVTITVGGTTVFGGYLTFREGSTRGAGNSQHAFWSCRCRDYAALLDRKIVTKGYTSVTDQAIIDDLFTTYLSGEGFDSTSEVKNVSSGLSIFFDRVTVREALKQLAALVTSGSDKPVYWYISPQKDVYWTDQANAAAAAFAINVDTSTNSPLDGTLRIGHDTRNVVNDVTVVVDEVQAENVQQDTFAANGSTSRFGPLTQRPIGVTSVTYTRSTSKTVIGNDIGTEPSGQVFDDGGVYNVIYNPYTRSVRIQETGTLVPDNATNVVVVYPYSTSITATAEDTTSKGTAGYNRDFELVHRYGSYQSYLYARSTGEDYAKNLVSEYANGRQTLKFDTTTHGLIPATKLTITAAILELSTSVFLIQEVITRAVPTESGNMIVSTVIAGGYEATMIDALRTLSAASQGQPLTMGGGNSPLDAVSKLSDYSANLGDVRVGKATFTDGGTGGTSAFSWSDYGGHSGAVLGLEEIDDTTDGQGAVYIMDGGVVKAKLGYLDGLADVGPITPTGWGLWTQNGYFEGEVAASTITGGTVTAAVFTGGTTTAGTISGALFTAGTVSAGTISGNYITTGTINAASMTGAIPSVATQTGGRLTAGTIDASAINSNTITAGTISGALITTGTINAAAMSGAIPSVATQTGGKITAGTVEASTMTANLFSGGTVTAGTISGNYITTGTINAAAMSGAIPSVATQTGGKITAGTVEASTMTANLFSGGTVTAGTISGNYITTGTINAAAMSGAIPSVATQTGGKITAGTVEASTMTANLFSGGTVTAGTISGNYITTGTINAAAMSGAIPSVATQTGGKITAGTVDASTFTGAMASIATITGGKITAGTVDASTFTGAMVSAGTITGGEITGGTVTGGIVNTASGTVTLDGDGITLSDSGGTITNEANIKWETGSDTLGRSFAYRDTTVGTTDIYEMRGGGFNYPTQCKIVSASSGTVVVMYLGDVAGTAGVGIDVGSDGLDFTITEDNIKTKDILPYGHNSDDIGSSIRSYRNIYLLGTVFADAINSGDVIPDTDNSKDLGSGSFAWRNLYIDGTIQSPGGNRIFCVDDWVPSVSDGPNLGDGTYAWGGVYLHDSTTGQKHFLDADNGQLRLGGTAIGP